MLNKTCWLRRNFGDSTDLFFCDKIATSRVKKAQGLAPSLSVERDNASVHDSTRTHKGQICQSARHSLSGLDSTHKNKTPKSPYTFVRDWLKLRTCGANQISRRKTPGWGGFRGLEAALPSLENELFQPCFILCCR